MDVVSSIGAAVTAGLGLMGLIKPTAAAAFTSMSPVGKLGTSEIRATYGGFFLALGVYALVTQSPVAFAAAGVAWLGAAGGRLFSIVVDRSTEPKNFGGVAFEGIIGALLLL